MDSEQTNKAEPLFSQKETSQIYASQPPVSIRQKILQTLRSLGRKIEIILKDI